MTREPRFLLMQGKSCLVGLSSALSTQDGDGQGQTELSLKTSAGLQSVCSITCYIIKERSGLGVCLAGKRAASLVTLAS